MQPSGEIPSESSSHDVPHAIPLDYAHKHRKERPAVHRNGRTVEIKLDPLPDSVMRRLGGEVGSPNRWLLVLDGNIHGPVGIIRPDHELLVRQPFTLPGIVELVARPPHDPKRARDPIFEWVYEYNREDGAIVVLYGSVNDDFDWLAEILVSVRRFQLRKRKG